MNFERWSKEGLQMLEDAKEGQIKHTILLDNDILIIKVLQKRGYSWVDINQDYKLNTDQKYMSNSDGRMIFKWC